MQRQGWGRRHDHLAGLGWRVGSPWGWARVGDPAGLWALLGRMGLKRRINLISKHWFSVLLAVEALAYSVFVLKDIRLKIA